MFEISDRIKKPGAINFTELDRAFLATVPPTAETIARAKELGESLGKLLAANESGHRAQGEITAEILRNSGVLFPPDIVKAFDASSFTGFISEQVHRADMFATVRESSCAEGVTI